MKIEEFEIKAVNVVDCGGMWCPTFDKFDEDYGTRLDV